MFSDKRSRKARFRLSITLLSGLVCLAACGQKGPLTYPAPPLSPSTEISNKTKQSSTEKFHKEIDQENNNANK